MAYRQGQLTHKAQSRVQRWALGYYHFSQIRDKKEDNFQIQKMLHLILRASHPKFYAEIFPENILQDPDALPGQTYTADDLEGIEKLLSFVNDKRRISQKKLDAGEDGDGVWR